MSLVNKSLVTIDDLSNGEMDALFSLADEMSDSMDKQLGLCQGKVMASLFFEPSTRTRLSFETAMHRLGGSVITAMEIGSTSLSKGESIADMARVIGSYADIIAIRHPWEGAAKLVADYAGVPVINAGDGSHEHPTQTLCDLYTLKKERKSIKGLKIALWGDLKNGRTIHSLTYALARQGASMHFRSGPGLELPEYVKRKLNTEYIGKFERYDNLSNTEKKSLYPLDAVYLTPSSPHQLTNLPDVSITIELKKEMDALYVTRLQKERLADSADNQELKRDYPVVDKKLLSEKRFRDALVMHPLPRVDELAHEMDDDSRSAYFRQAAHGVPIRMALIALLLKVKSIDITEDDKSSFIIKKEYPIYNRDSGITCQNRKCVSVQESEKRYLKPEFKIVDRKPLTLRCVYCEHEIHPKYIASSEKDKKYHSADTPISQQINWNHLIIFDSEEEAVRRGFSPSHFAYISKDGG